MTGNDEVRGALLPCPFCGSAQLRPDGPINMWIHCCGCGADGPETVGRRGDRDSTKARAIAAWNRRLQSPPSVSGELVELSAKATRGPWQVVEDRHPWTLPEREICGQVSPAAIGEHIQRRIFTEWDHPQSHSPHGVVNLAIGIGKAFVNIDEPDAAFIAAACNYVRSLIPPPHAAPVSNEGEG